MYKAWLPESRAPECRATLKQGPSKQGYLQIRATSMAVLPQKQGYPKPAPLSKQGYWQSSIASKAELSAKLVTLDTGLPSKQEGNFNSTVGPLLKKDYQLGVATSKAGLPSKYSYLKSISTFTEKLPAKQCFLQGRGF
jgi:hypothetical protein